MSDEDRWRKRQEKASPILNALHDWMLAQRDLVPTGSATAKTLDYSLKRWVALTATWKIEVSKRRRPGLQNGLYNPL